MLNFSSNEVAVTHAEYKILRASEFGPSFFFCTHDALHEGVKLWWEILVHPSFNERTCLTSNGFFNP